ncbi:hypothetical protein MJO29_013778 [Puccinia striiformis f. sp. tritici]|nr:hypothetical protein MJO29_013778 [Puccinia striiformis f. sp. tritici]KAI9613104.1 hypothetical protein H4Q26_010381 [Puccinia striiformis f. sp. tritici PST-130]
MTPLFSVENRLTTPTLPLESHPNVLTPSSACINPRGFPVVSSTPTLIDLQQDWNLSPPSDQSKHNTREVHVKDTTESLALSIENHPIFLILPTPLEDLNSTNSPESVTADPVLGDKKSSGHKDSATLNARARLQQDNIKKAVEGLQDSKTNNELTSLSPTSQEEQSTTINTQPTSVNLNTINVHPTSINFTHLSEVVDGFSITPDKGKT